MADERVTLRFVVTDEVSLKGGKLGYELHRILGDGSMEPAPRWYGQRGFKVYVGNVYDIEADSVEGTTIYTGTARYVGVWTDEDQRFEWQAKARALRTVRDMDRLARKEGTYDLLLDSLLPIRKVYEQVDSPSRRALEALVLQALRNPLH